MTAYRFVTLTCDRCHQIWDDGQSYSAHSARARAAREAGWTQHRRGGDLCGVCSGTHERIPGFGDMVRPVTHSTGLVPAEITSDEELEAERRDRRRHQPSAPESE